MWFFGLFSKNYRGNQRVAEYFSDQFLIAWKSLSFRNSRWINVQILKDFYVCIPITWVVFWKYGIVPMHTTYNGHFRDLNLPRGSIGLLSWLYRILVSNITDMEDEKLGLINWYSLAYVVNLNFFFNIHLISYNG